MKQKFGFTSQLLFLISMISLVLNFSCRQKPDDTKINKKPKPVRKITSPNYVPISGQYILVLKEPLAKSLTRFENTKEREAALLSAGAKTSSARFFNKLFAYLKVKEEDIKSVYRNLVVVNLDTIAFRKAKKDKRFKYVQQNYRILKPYGNPVLVFQPVPMALYFNEQEQDKNWGVDSILSKPRQNVNSAKRVWLVDGSVDKDNKELNIDMALSRSFVPNVQFYDLTIKKMFYHGTHVAGIIGARYNGLRVIGVAPNARIVVMKVVDNEVVDYSQYLKALQAVYLESKPGDILNLSIENTLGSQEEIDDIHNIGRKGVSVVIAAGNDDENIVTHPLYPAMITGVNIYTVSSYDQYKHFSTFSNFGKPIIIYCAPGENIYSTFPGNTYQALSGTSQAAPMVTGLLYLGISLKSAGTLLCAGDKNKYVLVHE